MKKYFAISFIAIINIVNCQAQVSGYIYEVQQSDTIALTGANVYLTGLNKGVVTGVKGKFYIDIPVKYEGNLVASFVGMISDTILVKDINGSLALYLKPNNVLKEVVVSERQPGSYISSLEPMKVENITRAGLEKLACCNLSESFENSATVDVNFTDAVTGAKQIKMLGLAGANVQILNEKIPEIRGLSSAYGLTFIPGWWLESIQVSKGAASVGAGYESLTGQINLELKKPQKTELLDVNLFANSEGRMESNILSGISINDKLSTSILTHGSFMQSEIDHNNDLFLDVPKSTTGNFMNRWNYKTDNLHWQVMINYLNDERKGGQVKDSDDSNFGLYTSNISNEKFKLSNKMGYRLKRPSTSIGWIAYAENFKLNGSFGGNIYKGEQNSIYSQVVLNTFLFNTNHMVSTGVGMLYDNYAIEFNSNPFNNEEIVPGAFVEYTSFITDNSTVILGLRADHHNKYGLLYTPRIHYKQNFFSDKLVIRSSAGKGYRSSNVFTDNIGYMASSRSWVIDSKLDVTESWNAGINLLYKFAVWGRSHSITSDYYHTNYKNLVFADIYTSARSVNVYNIKNGAFGNSVQTDLNLEITDNIDVTTAVRFNDVQYKINGTYQHQVLTQKFKSVFTLSYATRYNKWQYDITAIYNGKTELPEMVGNPDEFQLTESADPFVIIHSQLTRKFKHFELYVGGENLTGFKQKKPIIDVDNPESEFFDASMIWGPLSGRMIYTGLRYKLKR